MTMVFAHLFISLAFAILPSAAGRSVGGSVRSLPLLSHQQVHQRFLKEEGLDRKLQSTPGPLTTVSQVSGLYQGIGTHYVDVWCGNPRQRQTLIVGSGSTTTGFPCKGCDNCGASTYHTDGFFDGSVSPTFSPLPCSDCLLGSCESGAGQCALSSRYAEGSTWSGYEALDDCYVGGLHEVSVPEEDPSTDALDPKHAPDFAFNFTFACQETVTGLFREQLADGILGMGISDATLWNQMYKAGKIQDPAYSLCFRREYDAEKSGTAAGALSLGGYDPRLHDTPLVYSIHEPELRKDLFTVRLRKVYLRAGGGGKSARSTDPSLAVKPLGLSEAALNIGGVYLESGTTDSYFMVALRPSFLDAYKELTGIDYDHNPKSFTPEELAMQPTILLQLVGNQEKNSAIVDVQGNVVGLANDVDKENPLDVLVAIPPEHYYELNLDTGTYTARFYFDDSWDDTIGANALLGHDVLFDGETGEVGWAESRCNYTELVEKLEEAKKERKKSQASSGSTNRKQCGSGCWMANLLLLGVAAAFGVFLYKKYHNEREVSNTSAELEMNGVDDHVIT